MSDDENTCWCGMDHSLVEMDQDGNWYEIDSDGENE